jgi:hypothetical protein
VNLPSLSAAQAGGCLEICNPQNYTLTITPASGNSIVGAGALVTNPSTISVAAYTNVRLVVQYDNNTSTVYWALLT